MSSLALPFRRASRQARPRRARAGIGKLGVAAATVIAIATAMALLGPALVPYDPNAVQLDRAFVGPLGDHLLGYDSQGRDLLSRLVAGARTSMLGPLIVVLVATVAGTALAVATAWRGGWIDDAVSGVLDILFAFPAILLGVLTAAVLGPSLSAAALAIAAAYIPYTARVIRSAAAAERSRDYIAALEVQGASAISICIRHLLPNLTRLIVAEATIMFGWAMLDLAALSFLGLGVQPPQADWGVMVSAGEPGVLQGYPAESLAAGLAIVLTVVAFNLLGERLAERSLGGGR